MGNLKYKLDYDLDDPNRTALHGELIKSKPFLRKIYQKWYSELMEQRGRSPGKQVEIGSGGGFLKEVLPEVITSDIMPVPGCDMVFSAEQMPFADGEVSTIMMVNVFHHIRRPTGFLEEAFRVLAPGGRIVMIEPANTAFSRLIYTRFHHEDFDTRAGWTIKGTGPLSDSNQALPWIIFERDRHKFETDFPGLRIEKIRYHTPFLYLVSGGLSYRSLLPGWAFGAIAGLERLLAGLNGRLALFQTITISKTGTEPVQ